MLGIVRSMRRGHQRLYEEDYFLHLVLKIEQEVE